MAITTPTAGTVTVPLDKIHVPTNVRELDPDHVDGLAGSIALQGLLQPVLLTPADGQAAEEGFEYELTAGFHRYAAVKKLGHGAIDAVIRDRDPDVNEADIATARATENLARKQLNAYEEAVAVKAMLDRGLSEDGAAQALTWPKARVTARVKLLQLPDTAQKLVGAGVIPLAAVDTLRSVGEISPEVLDAVVDHVADGNDWIAEHLQTDIGRVIGQALRDCDSKVFAAYLTHVDSYEIEQLKLGKKASAQLTEAGELHKQINRYSYGGPTIRFSEAEIDQARAAGVLIESDGAPVIVDRPLYRELCKQALNRTVEDLRTTAAEGTERRKAEQAAGRDAKAEDPQAAPRREHARRTRQLAVEAHGVNLDLGWALRNGLSSVDPADIHVARFFTFALLGSDYTGSSYGHAGEQVLELAMTGVRLVVEEFREDVTKTKKDGTRGALRVSYGDPHQPEDPVAWMWKYIDGARTAGDLYGRALVVIAAQQYASRLVVPASQQHQPLGWHSHKDQAAKALAKLAGPHLPASYKQLCKAIAKAKADYDTQLAAAIQAQRTPAATSTPLTNDQQGSGQDE